MAKQPTLRRAYPAEYSTWNHMKRRCHDRNAPDWRLYGGLGVTVCREWMSFARFLRDMGPKPHPALTLDRKDSNGSYGPTNCRWATRQQQSANRRHCRKVTVRGKRLTIEEAARHLRVPPMTFRRRIYAGLSVPQAASRLRVPRRDSLMLTHCGRTLSLPEWARLLGVRVRTLRERIRFGMPLEKALTPGLMRPATV